MKLERKSTSLRHHVQDALREEIISGRFKPGERLVEQKLCEALDVSRTSLRESLRCLEAEGLLELIPHRGAVVASIGISYTIQIYQIRAELEVLAITNFIAYASDRHVNDLRSVLHDLKEMVKKDNVYSGTDLLDIKVRFYVIIYSICQNNILRQITETLNNRINYLRSVSLSKKGRIEHTLSELERIVDSIERHDVESASEAVRDHIEKAKINALNILEHTENNKNQPDRL